MFDPSDMNNEIINNKQQTSSTYNNISTIYDEASAIIPIELISNVIMYEDLALKDVEEYFEYQQQKT
jgi:hypothetical protein